MQIHEIMLREAGLLGAIGQAATQGIVSKFNAAAGVNDRFAAGTTASPEQAAGAAADLNSPLVKKMGQQAMAAWKKTVSDMMARNRPVPATQASQVPMRQLQQSLAASVNKLVGFDYTQIESKVDAEARAGTGKQLAKTIESNITKLINDILASNTAVISTPQTQAAEMKLWQQLAYNIAEAQNLAEFASTGGAAKVKDVTVDASGKMFYRNQPFDSGNPVHVAALKQQGGI